MTVHTATLDFADVAAGWRGILNGSLKLSRKQAGAVATQTGVWRGMPSFTGATEQDVDGWLTHGYKIDGMPVKGKNTRQRRKLKWSEESGDLDYGRVLAGEDAIFRDRRPRKNAQRAIKLEVELAMRASTPASVLTDYAVWLGKLITGFEGGGFQTQIDVVSRCRGLVSNDRHAQVDTHVRVKSFGRKGSKRSWSALLSPGGFRHLIFCARILACEQIGVPCSPGMGGSFGPSWDLTWDAKDRKLTIKCAAESRIFPAELMDTKLAAIKF